MTTNENKTVGKVLVVATKFGEYLLFIGLACVIMYFTLKSVFGTPHSFKETATNIETMKTNIDTLKTDNEVIMGELGNIRVEHTTMLNLMTEQNKLLLQNNREIVKLKKFVYEQNRTKSVPTVTRYNYNSLDSFFSNRYNRIYKK